MSKTPWQTKDYEAAQLQLTAKLAADFPAPEDALRFAFEEATNEERWGTNRHDLRRLLLILHALRLSADLDELRPTQEDAIGRLGEEILLANRIQPHVSRLSFLYAEMQDAMARCARRRGKHFQAAWLTRIGRRAKIAGEAGEDAVLLTSAEDALRAGDSRRALLDFDNLTESALSPAVLRDGLVGQLRTLRLRDDRSEFHTVVRMNDREEFTPEQRWRWEWEQVSLSATVSGDLRPLMQHVAKVNPAHHADKLLIAYLRVRATQTQTLRDRTVPPRLVWRRARRRREMPAAIANFCDVAGVLDLIDDKSLPLRRRLLDLGDALTRVPDLVEPEYRLAMWAAATRWLIQHHQAHLADLTLGEYHNLSASLSSGATKDLYAVFGDIEHRTLLDAMDLPLKTVDTPPPLKLAHTWHDTAFEISRLLASLARMVAKRHLRLSDTTTMAEVFTRFAASRRGVLLKVAQTINSIDGLVEEELRQTFDVLYVGIPAMTESAVRETFLAELGKAPEQLFRDFDYRPFSAGSIGQVHLAALPTGQRVAVKVQYPGIAKVVAMDMRQTRLLRPFATARLPHFDFDGVFNELHEHLLRELDYRQELRNLTQFRQFFADDPRVLIPEPYPHLSTGRILTMEFLTGDSVVDFAVSATQQEKNQAAETVLKTFARAHYQFGFFNPDVHASNFMFRRDGVGFVDFGCVKRFSSQEVKLTTAFQRALFDNDRTGFKEAYGQMGFFRLTDQIDWDKLFDLHLITQRAHLSRDPVCIDDTFVRDQREALRSIATQAEDFRVPKERVFAVRADPSLSMLLSVLQPKQVWRLTLEPIMSGRPASA